MANIFGESPSRVLTSDLTYYFASSGSDTTGNGSSLAPFATPQNCWDTAAATIDFNGFSFNIFFMGSSGTFAGIGAGLGRPSHLSNVGAVTIKGDNTTPGNCVFTHQTDMFGPRSGIFMYGAAAGYFPWISGIRFASTGYAAIDISGGGFQLGEPTFTEASKCEYACAQVNSRTFFGAAQDNSLGVSTFFSSFMVTPTGWWQLDNVNATNAFIYGPDFTMSGTPNWTDAGVNVGNGCAGGAIFAAPGGAATGRKIRVNSAGSNFSVNDISVLWGNSITTTVEDDGLLLVNSIPWKIAAAPVTFANLPASVTDGMIYEVTDSTVNNQGYAVTTGGGSYRVLVYYQTQTSQWICIGSVAPVRRTLVANENFYCSSAGSDVTGTGSSGNPWQNPQTWYDYTINRLDLGGFNSICNLADGTYKGIYSFQGPVGNGYMILIGNNTTPSNITITGSTTLPNTSIFLGDTVSMWVSGVTLYPSTAASRAAIDVDLNDGFLYIGEPSFTLPTKVNLKGIVVCNTFQDNTLDVGTIDGPETVHASFGMFNTFSAKTVNGSIYGPDWQISSGALGVAGPFFQVNSQVGGVWITNSAFPFVSSGSFSGTKFNLAGGAELNSVGPLSDIPGTMPDNTIGRGYVSHNVKYNTVYGQALAIGDPRTTLTSTSYTLPAFSATRTIYINQNMQFDNIGSTGTVTVTLPAVSSIAVGTKFGFCCASSLAALTVSSTTAQIALGSINSTGGTISSTTQFSYAEIEAISTSQWVGKFATGTWAIT